jgi:uncharacterized repeat protein (TIGR01451 family)
VDSEQIRNEAKPLFYLCKAWQKMTMAEARVSPGLYAEAAELFKLAKEHMLNESASLLALANSSFCRALEAGTQFEITRKGQKSLEAREHMNDAANYYLKAGFDTSAEYAKATQRLFDAYVFMENAKRETKPGNEVKYYLMAEKVLQLSAESFAKAKYTKKTNQVERLLARVKEEKELALSLSEVFHAPSIASSTASFETISLSEEKAVGLARFEHSDVEAKLIKQENEVTVGQELSLDIQVANLGKEPVWMTKIEDIIPAGFQILKKPENSSFENATLTFKAKRLNPLTTEEIRVVLRPFKKGCFTLKPRITCIDETGSPLLHDPEALTLDISEAVLSGRVSTGSSDLDSLLLGGIPDNYAVILTSPSSDEREMLVRNFLEVGVKGGQTVFYITGDASGVEDLAREFASNFYVFVCNPGANPKIDNSPNVFKLQGVENLTEINISIFKALRSLSSSETSSRRACIEVLSDVLLQHHAVVTKNWLSGLLQDLKSKGFTTLAVVNSQMHPQEEVQAILDQFGGEIQIYERETKEGLRQVLRIRKLYGQRYLDNELILQKPNVDGSG